jgi:hypothetical protein
MYMPWLRQFVTSPLLFKPGHSLWNFLWAKWNQDRFSCDPPISIILPIGHKHSSICHPYCVILITNSVIKNSNYVRINLNLSYVLLVSTSNIHTMGVMLGIPHNNHTVLK